MNDPEIPQSYCTICGKRIPFVHKGSAWRGLACSLPCWRKLEFRYAIWLIAGNGAKYDKTLEDAWVTANE